MRKGAQGMRRSEKFGDLKELLRVSYRRVSRLIQNVGGREDAQ